MADVVGSKPVADPLRLDTKVASPAASTKLLSREETREASSACRAPAAPAPRLRGVSAPLRDVLGDAPSL